MGLSDADAQSSLRITMGRGTTKEDIENLVSSLTDITKSN
jgi:cysteine sulfinate desulfinase/cysteine desulfurase-like protein